MDISNFFIKKAGALQKQLQNLLESSPTTNDNGLFLDPFIVSTQLNEMDELGIGLPNDLRLKVRILFSRLNPFFEAGVLFSKTHTSWSPMDAFQRGNCFELSTKERQMEFDFPPMSLVEVKRARSHFVINDLGLNDYLNNPKMTALAFSPHPDFLFLVLSELADPWLKMQIEKAQEQALRYMVDHF